MINRNNNGVIGLTSVLLWILVFLSGLTINSEPYRKELLNGIVTFKNILQ